MCEHVLSCLLLLLRLGEGRLLLLWLSSRFEEVLLLWGRSETRHGLDTESGRWRLGLRLIICKRVVACSAGLEGVCRHRLERIVHRLLIRRERAGGWLECIVAHAELIRLLLVLRSKGRRCHREPIRRLLLIRLPARHLVLLRLEAGSRVRRLVKRAQCCLLALLVLLPELVIAGEGVCRRRAEWLVLIREAVVLLELARSLPDACRPVALCWHLPARSHLIVAGRESVVELRALDGRCWHLFSVLLFLGDALLLDGLDLALEGVVSVALLQILVLANGLVVGHVLLVLDSEEVDHSHHFSRNVSEFRLALNGVHV